MFIVVCGIMYSHRPCQPTHYTTLHRPSNKHYLDTGARVSILKPQREKHVDDRSLRLSNSSENNGCPTDLRRGFINPASHFP